MSFEPADGDLPAPYDFKPANETTARERVLFPGIFLVVVGVLNLFCTGLLILAAFVYRAVPADQFEKIIAQHNPRAWDEWQRQGHTAQGLMDIVVRFFFTSGGFTGLTSVLILIGAIRMIRLRSYGMAVSGSVLSIIPFLSPSSCLMLGVFAGVWALVVLLDPDVREAFL